jgi:hypothetical protein
MQLQWATNINIGRGSGIIFLEVMRLERSQKTIIDGV